MNEKNDENDITDENQKNALKSMTIKDILDNNHIQVPVIQREYVWGNNSEVVKQFLISIKEMCELKKDIKDIGINIGFLYSYKVSSSGSDTVFYLIDGQQRFTTIILLLWYCALNNESDWKDFQEKLHTENSLITFSYKVRASTEQFLIDLFKNQIEKDSGIIEKIKNQKWYYSSYETDPSIKAMLATIQEFINTNTSCITYSVILEHIQFWYYPIAEEKQSDAEELYITMNSRGEALTDSEQIKPLLFKNETSDADKQNEFGKQWDDMEEFFFSEYLKYKEHPEEQTSQNDNEFDIKSIDTAVNNIIIISYEIKEYKVADKLLPQELSKDIKLNDIFETFNNYKNILEDKILQDNYQQLSDCKNSIFSKTREKISLYSLEASLVLYGKNANSYNILRIIRIIKNCLAYNSNISNESFLNFLYYLKDNLKEDIYECLEEYWNNNKDNNKILAKEEYEKIQAIKKDELKMNALTAEYDLNRTEANRTEAIIKEAEQFAFFKGRIHFLYHDGKGNADWEHFEKKWKNAQLYFRVGNECVINDKYEKDKMLLRFFISNFNSRDKYASAVFDDSIDTWERYLYSRKYSIIYLEDIDNLLSNTIDINKKSLEPKDCFNDNKILEKDLTSDLLTKIDKGSTLRFYSSYYYLMPYNAKPDWKKYFVGIQRNRILSELFNEGKITSNQKIEDIPFFWGWYVDFQYSNHNYRWNIRSNEKKLDVYLMNDENDWLKKSNKKANSENGNDNYYCFSVDDNETIESFTNKLDGLIAAAVENSQTAQSQ